MVGITMTVFVKQANAELVIETLLGLPVDMSRLADYPTTYDFKMMLTSSQGM